MRSSLTTYRAKRDFSKTREPMPRVAHGNKKPIFVVQKHRARALHYDFRLEHRGVLKSWALPKGPPHKAGERRLAVMTEDHPLPYAHFEGTIPKGQYGAGRVEIWDSGVYAPVKPLSPGLRAGHITFVLLGHRLKGEYALVRMKDQKNWLMLKAKKKL